MSKNRIEGAAKEVVGGAKQAVGKAVGKQEQGNQSEQQPDDNQQEERGGQEPLVHAPCFVLLPEPRERCSEVDRRPARAPGDTVGGGEHRLDLVAGEHDRDAVLQRAAQHVEPT